ERKAELDDLILSSPVQPPNVHPRLYGTDDQWAKRFEAFDQLDADCTLQGGNGGVGTVNNVKRQWEMMVRGGRSCDGNLPSTPAEHGEADEYMDGSVDTTIKANNDRRLRVLYLLRYLRYCHAQNPGNEGACQFTAADTQALSENFIE